jgi:hypothetical protein
MMSEVNPFESPKTSSHQFQKRQSYARVLSGIRARGGRFSTFLRFNRWRMVFEYSLIFGCMLFGPLFFDWDGRLIAGIFLGLVIRDLNFMRIQAEYWPLTSDFMDWKKIEEVAELQGDV